MIGLVLTLSVPNTVEEIMHRLLFGLEEAVHATPRAPLQPTRLLNAPTLDPRGPAKTTSVIRCTLCSTAKPESLQDILTHPGANENNGLPAMITAQLLVLVLTVLTTLTALEVFARPLITTGRLKQPPVILETPWETILVLLLIFYG